MNRQKLLSLVSLCGGIVVMIIGIAHTAYTRVVYGGLVGTAPGKAVEGAYFFAAMGIYIIFAGWLMIYSARGLGRSEAWAWTLAFTNGLCNLLAGIGAAAIGIHDAFPMTWLGVSAVIVLLTLAFHSGYRKTA